MCTVSYIPVSNKVFITTNRDESIYRSAAKPPDSYTLNHQRMIFPMDGEAGGTWVAAGNTGNTGVLLNGAFQKHQRRKNYKKSRGIVLLEIMETAHPAQVFGGYDFYQIEPFTLVLLQNNTLFECRWNGQKTHIKELDTNAPHFWCSSTLYNAEIQARRLSHFNKWLMQQETISDKEITAFHRTLLYEKEKLPAADYFTHIKTVSITSVQLNEQKVSIDYYDQLQNKKHAISMDLVAGLNFNKVV